MFFADAGRSGFLIIRAEITAAEQPKQLIDAAYEHMRYRWVIVVDDVVAGIYGNLVIRLLLYLVERAGGG